MINSPSNTNRSTGRSRCGLDHLREIASEGPLAARLQMDRITVPEEKASEAVVFGFEQPACAAWEIIDWQRLHWNEGERDLKRHSERLLSLASSFAILPAPIAVSAFS